MTVRIKSGLAAIAFSVLSWAVIINTSLAYFNEGVSGLDRVATAGASTELFSDTR